MVEANRSEFLVRRLNLSEWEHFTSLHQEAFEEAAPHPLMSQVLVVEDGDKFVGFAVAQYVMHLEPIWVAPDYRSDVRVVRSLLTKLREVFGNVAVAFAHTNRRSVSHLLERLGFTQLVDWHTYRYVRRTNG